MSRLKSFPPRNASGDESKSDAHVRADVAIVFDDSTRQVAFSTLTSDGSVVVERVPLARLRDALQSAVAPGADGRAAQFLTCAPHFTEGTAPLYLSAEQLALAPDDLLLALAEAAETNAPLEVAEGEEAESLMPEAARDEASVWDYARTPEGGFTFTSAARASLDEVASRIAADAIGYDVASGADEELYLEFRCETMVRAALRAQLHSLDAAALPAEENLASALVVFTALGYSVGLWSPVRGLFLEDAEPFNAGEEIADLSVVARSVEHALSNLLLRLSPAQLREYGYGGVERVWWASSPALRESVAEQMAFFVDDYAERFAATAPAPEFSHASFAGESDEFAGFVVSPDPTPAATGPRLDVSEAAAPLEELTARGLLLASHPAAALLLPPINLAEPAPERAAAIQNEREEREAVEQDSRARRLKVAACVPLIIALGLVFGGYVKTLWESHTLSAAFERETAEQARLAPVAERRKAATEVLTWVSSYLEQVTELRRRQPASLSLLAELDARYPVAEDDTFTVLALDAMPDGNITIQGLTKRDAAVSALITSLEFSPTDATGKKLFINPVYELRKPQVGGVNLPQMPAGQGTIQAVQSPRPDVTAWTVRAIYTPLQRDSAVTPKPAPPKAEEKK